MDEGTLNDLLECSVCLERLDTSSKVLPCQHTFCRKCLLEILHKHKELRCPECRVLVTAKIDDLPPNVLLMRILEGMKNSGVVAPPKRAQKSHKSSLLHQTGNQNQLHFIDRSNNKHSSGYTALHQPYAKALYDYLPKEPGDLSFKKGDIIILKKKVDSNWYQGECAGKQGVFPLSYVQIITPVPSHIPQCKALYDFRMNNDEEEGCLAFNKGNVINVIRRVDENWAEGKLDGRIGIFPLAFVEMNSLARSLMKLSTNVQPGPSKVAPPTPTAEDSTPLIPTDHSTAVTQNLSQQISESGTNKVTSSSSSTTPNVSSSNTSSNSSTAPSSPASPPVNAEKLSVSPRNNNSRKPGALEQQTLIHSLHSRTIEGRSSHHHHHHHHHQGKEKRHSLNNMSVSHPTSAHRHSAEIVQSSSASQMVSSSVSDRSSKRSAPPIACFDFQLPATFMALYPYKPQKPDELELKKGGIYTVTEICQDGWYKGTSNRTQKCGVFPGNYVTKARAADLNTPFPGVVGSSDSKLPNKERKEKGTVSLMRRLASMKRSKSPPPSSYSMDNPVFEDSTVSSSTTLSPPSQPVHVRSGSCPGQLVQIPPTGADHHNRLFGSVSHRMKHKERPSILNHNSRSTETPQGGSTGSSPDVHRHRKSHSLDATGHKSSKTSTQTVRERFKCIAPYPPNGEYELELQMILYMYTKNERTVGIKVLNNVLVKLACFQRVLLNIFKAFCVLLSQFKLFMFYKYLHIYYYCCLK
ncbi:hypothetical protein ABEB36_005033 [Hypothenemus hampei]|uniref:RING-type E3 ubiquitin transferase n=1 Tax=Hypothenemus hampei TaxID=57062 RepID=A0ABD1EWQ3_HYPHA